MKTLLLSVLLISPIAFMGLGCTATKNTGTAVAAGTKEAAQETNATITDASITAAVKMKMADDPDVSANHIDVDTKDGMVTLNGIVKSQVEAQKAVDIAKSVDGVKGVKSNLKIPKS
jgi:hyperosmotically inducible periplasmic protein